MAQRPSLIRRAIRLRVQPSSSPSRKRSRRWPGRCVHAAWALGMRLWQTAGRCKDRAGRGRLFALARTPEPRIMAAPMAASHITTSGLVEDWPAGFSASLPDAHWLVVHAYPRQEKKLILELRARRLPGCAFFERRIRHYPGKGTQ